MPEDWILANRTSILNKGSKKIINTYRSISLISFVVKLLEIIIKYFVLSYFDSQNILNMNSDQADLVELIYYTVLVEVYNQLNR